MKRDLLREEERVKIEERRKHSDTLMLPPSLPMTSEIRPGSTFQHKGSPILSTIPGRRGSAISISSLHRPQFPLKLDLSSTSLRITEEEAAMFKKGLASPVTLAPKSARLGPNEFPPEFMAAFANSSVPPDVTSEPPAIDLTLPHVPQEENDSTMNNGVGDSSDKPIELDLDIEMANMTDIFGDPDPDDSEDSNIRDGLFSPVLNEEPPQTENFENFAANPDLVSQLAAGEPSILQPQSTSVPSPGSLLAQFSSSRMMDHKPSPSDNVTIPIMTENFDINAIDLSNLPTGFFSNAQDSGVSFPMDMEAFLTLETGEEKGEGESNQSAT